LKKREIVFFVLSMVYFFGCMYATSNVSGAIVVYIREHGWTEFNQWAFGIGGFMAGVIGTLLLLRVWLKQPTWSEVLVGVLGGCFSFFVLWKFVLLTTELIHIPQFMLLTVMIFCAFPRWRQGAWLFSLTACIGDEWLQSYLAALLPDYMPGRILDINDIFLNFIGMYLGLLLWWSFSIFSLWAHSACVERPPDQ
jgi:hypothetical protein